MLIKFQYKHFYLAATCNISSKHLFDENLWLWEVNLQGSTSGHATNVYHVQINADSFEKC